MPDLTRTPPPRPERPFLGTEVDELDAELLLLTLRRHIPLAALGRVVAVGDGVVLLEHGGAAWPCRDGARQVAPAHDTPHPPPAGTASRYLVTDWNEGRLLAQRYIDRDQVDDG